MKKKKPTPQERNVRETEQLLKSEQRRSLFIDGLSAEEMDAIRRRIFHSAAGNGYIATWAEMLPSALHLLTSVRHRRKAKLENRKGQWWLTVKPR